MTTTKRLSKEEAMQIVREDLQRDGVPHSRRKYARDWNVPPSTAYYWIKEAVAQHIEAEEVT